MKHLVLALALFATPLALAGCANDVLRSQIAQEIEVEELVAMERSKWDLAASDPQAFAQLLAVDFYSVEYGENRGDPLRRMTKAQVLERLPLPAASFEIADVRVVRPTPSSAILSYRVRGPAVAFEGFATSHWVRRNGAWETIFYQITAEQP